jgi:AcrR family transcriptional regulator
MSAKTESTKRNILNAAFECFVQYGYSKITFKDMALKAGISRASLYLYFKNKHDLFITMNNELNDDHVEKSQEILNSDLPDKEKLSKIISVWVIEPYSRIKGTPYANSWLDELKYTAAHTETRFRQLFIKSISPLTGKELGQVLVLAIKGLMDDRPPVKLFKQRIGILIEHSTWNHLGGSA